MMIYMDSFHIHKDLWMTLKLNESPAHSIGNNRVKCVNTDPMTRTKNMGSPPFTEIYDIIIWKSTFQKYEWYIHDIFQFVVKKQHLFQQHLYQAHLCWHVFNVEALAPFSTKSNHFNVLKAKLGSQETDIFFAKNGWFTGVFIEEQKMLRLKPIEAMKAWYWLL